MKLLLLIFLTLSLYAEENSSIEENISREHNLSAEALIAIAKQKEEEERAREEAARKAKELKEHIATIQLELNDLEEAIKRSKIWMKSYSSYVTYKDLRNRLENIDKEIDTLQENNVTENLEELQIKQKILSNQAELLREHGHTPFANLLEPEDIGQVPNISNPFDVFAGISYIKNLNKRYSDYVSRKKELLMLLKNMRNELMLYSELSSLEPTQKNKNQVRYLSTRLVKFEEAFEIIEATSEVFKKRIDEIDVIINREIEDQVYKIFNIAIVIVVLLVLFFLVKLIAKRYISDNERFYMFNKITTFVNITLIILILLFSYIENVNYLITVLGFASAGIAIAMKDWFMSMLGWLVIIFGGAIHTGDRVKFVKDGMEYVGDVLDISFLRITLLEDITLTTYMENRRAGRVIFVPNNYVFTSMVANYSHASLKTVWDGIDITITFESNHRKALQICKDITKKFSKGYTDITRKQLNKLRSQYSLKNTNVEPRIFSFIEPNGLRISSWYLTNAYATLTLRSVISTEIVDAFNAEEDIIIAYPTQKMHYSHDESPKKLPFDEDEKLV